ncbi:MAG: cytochrome c family protein [Desulfobacterales bacterium]|nr:cytochrome c family protein [Desulfobacterales bacterium]
MEAKKEKNIVYALVIILLLVGVVAYAAYPNRAPEDPVRIMLKNTAGNVLFDHKIHTSESGYGFACVDCHHTLEDPKDKPEACGECHDADSSVKRSDAFHNQCKKCHEDGGSGPVECSGCHVL